MRREGGEAALTTVPLTGFDRAEERGEFMVSGKALGGGSVVSNPQSRVTDADDVLGWW